MTNEQKLETLRNITLIMASKSFMKKASGQGAQKEIDKLMQDRAFLEAALDVAVWLEKEGYTLTVGYKGGCCRVVEGHERIAQVAAFYVDDNFARKIPVLVDCAEEVKDAQILAWKNMTQNEKVLFVLRERIKTVGDTIEKASQYLDWLNAECDD